MDTPTPGILILADGTHFEGISVGHIGTICGEAVFNTSQTGYQEILTDPSYAGQFIVFTHPHIGNVGVNAEDRESSRIFACGAIMHSFSEVTSNWRAEDSLKNFLIQQKCMALSEVDTRALTHHLRQFGSQNACLMTGDMDYEKALQAAKNFPGLINQDLTQVVTTEQRYCFSHFPNAPHLIVFDFGVKRSILKRLAALHCSVTVVPATTTAEVVLNLAPDGIVLSNGPGDPAACTEIIETIKTLLHHRIPLLAICLGHQLLALASGAQTEKMKFGHHGANHPVKNIQNGMVYISSQNHGFVVADNHLPACLSVTHRSLFDHTIAGIERTDVPAFGFQGHPEAGPGPLELTELFRQFQQLVIFEMHYA